jgi:hypothetical protein
LHGTSGTSFIHAVLSRLNSRIVTVTGDTMVEPGIGEVARSRASAARTPQQSVRFAHAIPIAASLLVVGMLAACSSSNSSTSDSASSGSSATDSSEPATDTDGNVESGGDVSIDVTQFGGQEAYDNFYSKTDVFGAVAGSEDIAVQLPDSYVTRSSSDGSISSPTPIPEKPNEGNGGFLVPILTPLGDSFVAMQTLGHGPDEQVVGLQMVVVDAATGDVTSDVTVSADDVQPDVSGMEWAMDPGERSVALVSSSAEMGGGLPLLAIAHVRVVDESQGYDVVVRSKLRAVDPNAGTVTELLSGGKAVLLSECESPTLVDEVLWCLVPFRPETASPDQLNTEYIRAFDINSGIVVAEFDPRDLRQDADAPADDSVGTVHGFLYSEGSLFAYVTVSDPDPLVPDSYIRADHLVSIDTSTQGVT